MLKIGTPLVVPSKENIYLGRCVSIEDNHVQKDSAGVGSLVAIAIQVDTFDMQRYAYGRHFDLTDKIYSRVCIVHHHHHHQLLVTRHDVLTLLRSPFRRSLAKRSTCWWRTTAMSYRPTPISRS